MTGAQDSARACLLVFSDLDGTLLDHNTYAVDAALPRVRELERRGIPLLLCSSKTRVEIESLRVALDNRHPFIIENGAAICIPRGYFATPEPDTVERGGYTVHELSARRQRWLGILRTLQTDFEGEFLSFSAAGTDGIMDMTGLDAAAARAANEREYSEPVRWLGSGERREAFIARLRALGATALQGGRFLSVSGPCDKGVALRWLRAAYGRRAAGAVHDLAAGDSANDCAMLEAAETALWVRSPAHDFPALQRSRGILYSKETGPAGWSEGVGRWLATVQSR